MRKSGILLHISSLPSDYGIGKMGSAAYAFADFLVDAGVQVWQILPLSPTSYGDSPYQSFSVYAGNPYFIDYEQLEQEGLLTRVDYAGLIWDEDPRRVDYALLYRQRRAVLRKAAERLLSAPTIYVLGLRSAAPLAQFFGYYLHFIFDDVRVVAMSSTDVFESIARIRPSDVLVGISFPRYSTRTLEAMRFAHESGAQVIGLTDGPMSPLHQEADICLSARTDMASFVDSLAAPLSVINALLVALAMKKRDDLNRHFARLEEIWDAYSVYINKENQ